MRLRNRTVFPTHGFCRYAFAIFLSLVCNAAQANVLSVDDFVAIERLHHDAAHLSDGLPLNTAGGFYSVDTVECSASMVRSLTSVAFALENAMALVKIASEMKMPEDESVVISEGVLHALQQSMGSIQINLGPIKTGMAACSKADFIVSKTAAIGEFVDRSSPILGNDLPQGSREPALSGP